MSMSYEYRFVCASFAHTSLPCALGAQAASLALLCELCVPWHGATAASAALLLQVLHLPLQVHASFTDALLTRMAVLHEHDDNINSELDKAEHNKTSAPSIILFLFSTSPSLVDARVGGGILQCKWQILLFTCFIYLVRILHAVGRQAVRRAMLF